MASAVPIIKKATGFSRDLRWDQVVFARTTVGESPGRVLTGFGWRKCELEPYSSVMNELSVCPFSDDASRSCIEGDAVK